MVARIRLRSQCSHLHQSIQATRPNGSILQCTNPISLLSRWLDQWRKLNHLRNEN